MHCMPDLTEPYPFPWDENKAASLRGSLVLIGITYLDSSGRERMRLQAYGVVVEADKYQGIAVECHGETWQGQIARFPPDTDAWDEAVPGKYELNLTGEVVIDPAYTTTWTRRDPDQ